MKITKEGISLKQRIIQKKDQIRNNWRDGNIPRYLDEMECGECHCLFSITMKDIKVRVKRDGFNSNRKDVYMHVKCPYCGAKVIVGNKLRGLYKEDKVYSKAIKLWKKEIKNGSKA